KSMRQQYADAKRKSDNTATASEVAAKAVGKVTEQARRTVRFVRSHSRMFVIVLALLAVLMIFMSMISSCAMIFQGVLGSLSSSTTYPSDAADMVDVETAYCDMEAELQEILDDYEDSGCIVNGSVPGHDPYVLTAILSAIYGEYTLSDVQPMLELLFEMQYELTEEDVIFYDEIVCVVTLEYTPMEDLLDDLLTEEQKEQYEIYMETQGNYPDLFPVE
ncbi:MAG: NlpC/P60 family protein, partial [Clostridia bacterium]|nr:NlpC/P60 family protein [Clostridia bacterium]